MLVREDAGEDPIGAFLDYVDVRDKVAEPPMDNLNDPWWEKVRRLFQAYRLMLKLPAENIANEIKRLEAELPEDFLILAQNSAFITLLRGIGDYEVRKDFRGQLIRRPLVTARVTTWPSTEWDKLSDEEFWAELAADKPIAPMANKAQDRDERPNVAINLGDAVQAAHGEGFNFGQSIARDAPPLWLEAVLARRPRMPQDLEARLLQNSALPIDVLLHGEVRQALRRGFWDALDRTKR